ncbi:MAG: hypothetical protein A3C07_05130 [Candidatus Sungbacteria bacterium RIFCSPHIGHO2_02_FULL_47_11]|uniref:Uncharacterized protein n=1 Tax=Candidatus Sungbacteria bacterium RIFCSPHIGHO2_02_FULL_47_11 TaxID=1802270 RepID=A0A1G2KR77_9BACT|nr:MAG: hypothetical protein A3C07_05130 [Candidatus Sungbacteria bacterium RIFCSPHIGHO2_02_FULL_47_11]
MLIDTEEATIKSIVAADPVPKTQKKGKLPCGTCRHLIWSHGTTKTTVILMQYILGKRGWTFPKIEKYNIRKLYPHPYEPTDHSIWDNFVPQ